MDSHRPFFVSLHEFLYGNHVINQVDLVAKLKTAKNEKKKNYFKLWNHNIEIIVSSRVNYVNEDIVLNINYF